MTNFMLRVACCTALAISLPVVAAPGPGHQGPNGMAAGERLHKALDLTDEQQEALQQARREAMAAHREARAQGTDPRQLRQEHAQAMREVYEGILTAEQLDKLATMRDERGSRGERRREHLVERLDLRADQVDPVMAILADARQGAAADAADRQERRAAVREQLSAILTPEQMRRFDAMVSEGRGHAGGWRGREGSGS